MAAGALFVMLARRLDPAAARRMIAIGLVAAALIYIGFALPVGDGRWLMIEAAGLPAFGAIAWLGSRAAGWSAVGWMAHVVWDVALTWTGPNRSWVPGTRSDAWDST